MAKFVKGERETNSTKGTAKMSHGFNFSYWPRTLS